MTTPSRQFDNGNDRKYINLLFQTFVMILNKSVNAWKEIFYNSPYIFYTTRLIF